MNVTADTNVLVRAIVADDVRQSRIACEVLAQARSVAIPTAALCELVWVLRQGYKKSPQDIARVLRTLTGSANTVLNRPSVNAGLAMLEAGGDFADGVIAHEGRWLGADTFVSFDKAAVSLLQSQGEAAELL